MNGPSANSIIDCPESIVFIMYRKTNIACECLAPPCLAPPLTTCFSRRAPIHRQVIERQLADNLSLFDHSGTRFSHSVPRRASHYLDVYQAEVLAYIAVHLLSFVKDDANYQKDVEKPARHALLILNYSALFFGLSAAISATILTHEFGGLPVRASRRRDPIQQGTFDSSTLDLLRDYGAKRSSVWIIWHCMCLYLLRKRVPHPYRL
jgi:hypothetical protein